MNVGDCVTWTRHKRTIPARILIPGVDGHYIAFSEWTCIPTASGRCTTLARQWWVTLDELTPVRRDKAA